jgi:hypothetical protein
LYELLVVLLHGLPASSYVHDELHVLFLLGEYLFGRQNLRAAG